MCGKPLKGAFPRRMGWVGFGGPLGGGGLEPYFFLQIGRHHSWFVFFSACPGHFFWGGGRGTPPPYFGTEKFKKVCFGEGWDSPELYKGKIMKKCGRTSLLMGFYPEWQQIAILPLKIAHHVVRATELKFGRVNCVTKSISECSRLLWLGCDFFCVNFAVIASELEF